MSLFKVLFLVAFAALLVVGTEGAGAEKLSVETASVANAAFPVQKKDDIHVLRSGRRLQGSPVGRRLQAPPVHGR